MRIVTWNSSTGLSGERWHLLESLEPDIAVVSAVETRIWLPADTGGAASTRWGGTNPAKGLGVFSFGEWVLDAPADESRVPWVVPSLVKGPSEFLLLSVWTENREGRPDDAVQLAEAIDAYRDELAGGDTVLAGDIDVSSGDPTRHLGNIAMLRNLGLDTAYGPVAGIAHGYVFIPQAWKDRIRSVEIGSSDEWVATGRSSHVPTVVDLDL